MTRLPLRALVTVVLCTVALASLASSLLTASQAAGTRGSRAQGRTLSFAERVAYQRAVDEVYWRHTTWPQQNGRVKPSLDEVVPLEATRAKVAEMLRKSEALARLWGRPVTGEQLQAELERQARETRQPEVLRELWRALGDDPFVVAEVLARSVLVERLVRNFYADEGRFHEGVRERARAELEAGRTLAGLRRAGAQVREVESIRVEGGEAREAVVAREPSAPAVAGEASELNPSEFRRERERLGEMFPGAACEGCDGASAKLPVGVLSDLQESAEGFYVTSVLSSTESKLKVARVEWPKQSFDSWWEAESQNYSPEAAAAADYNYELVEVRQAVADDAWTPTRALPARGGTVVWTGTEMIVWGGGSGSRYNPTTETWTPTAAIGAPSARGSHTAVWTGTEMIIWGGCGQASNFCGLKDGKRYDPSTDTWRPVSTANAPGPRRGHVAVWTGSKMIVWGGCSPGYNNSCSPATTRYLNSGGVYDPSTDTWQSTSGAGAPDGGFYRAVWTGAEMIVLNGQSGRPGGRYRLDTDSWAPVNTLNAPSPRTGFSMTWTGAEVVVWGGSVEGYREPLGDGARYNPASDAWTPVSKTNAPSPRSGHSAVWTGTEMLLYGGDLLSNLYFTTPSNTGYRYNPGSDTWAPISTNGAPPSANHAALWTGTEMILWGTTDAKSGARYNPSTDSWAPTDKNDSPEPLQHAVWTGVEMAVWGRMPGCSSGCQSTGALYNPATYSWRPMSTAGAPMPGGYSWYGTTVWTGTEMIVWGGDPGEAGRYNPQTNTWAGVSRTNSPAPRVYHTAVWSGSEMIVWGGDEFSSTSMDVRRNTGARYNPQTDSWTQTSTVNAPAARYLHTAVWAGGEMIVWGGIDAASAPTATGGRYSPATDSWAPVSAVGAPSARYGHTSVWTGNELVVWGGRTGDYSSSSGILKTGGRYNPASSSWTPTSLEGAPRERFQHTAVWTGSLMIVWGGLTPGCYVYTCGTHTGARYNPASDAWTPTGTHRGPGARSGHFAFWTDMGMIVWGGTADEGAAQHGAIYGAPGASPNNRPPTLRISSPAAGSTFESGARVEVTAEAGDEDGAVTAVHFYVDGAIVGSDRTAPYSHALPEVRGGTYSLTAVATDDGGAATRSAPVAFNVNPSTAPPTCVMVSPKNGENFPEPSNIPFHIESQANRDRTIVRGEVFKNGASLLVVTSAPPWTFNYGGLGAGTYTFSARCDDNAGTVVTTEPVTVTVGAVPTTARITGQLLNRAGQSIGGVRVRLDGPEGTAAQFSTSNSAGYFQFYSLPKDRLYTVTPESTLYTFDPPSRVYGLTQDQDDAIFTATNPIYAITGRLTDAAGNPIYPATVNLSGSKVASGGTDYDGYYRFFNLAAGGTYTVQAYRNHYNFDPPTRTFADLSADQTADFRGTIATYMIGGRVTLSGSPVAGATVTLSGTQSASTSTGADGSYVFRGLPSGGNYAVAASKTNHTFSPASHSFANIAGDYTAADFGASGSAEVVTLGASADAYVKGSTPEGNYGTAAELQVKRTYNPGAGKGRQAYIRFNTSSVAGTVTHARLRVYGRLSAVTAANQNIPLAVFPVSTLWEELLLNWANKPLPNVPQELGRVTVTDATARWYEFDITAFINQERAAGRNVTGVLLRNMLRGDVGDFYTVVNSREAAANQPQLVIEYVR